MSDDRLRELYAAALSRRVPETRDGCPAPEDLLALAEHRAPAARREAVLDHLTTCAACHADFTLLRATAGAMPRAPRVPWQWGLAAATLLAAAGAGWWALGRPAADRVRGGTAGLEVVGPGSTAGRGGLMFVWRAVPGVSGYEVRVAAPGSPPRSLGTTLDTVLTPVEPPAPGRYEWTVRALFPDGRALHSAPRELTITP